MPETAVGVMRMSADDDDQADQQHELADPGMAETDHSVLIISLISWVRCAYNSVQSRD